MAHVMVKEEMESDDSDSYKSDASMEDEDLKGDIFIDSTNILESSDSVPSTAPNALPVKSKEVYENLYKRFTEWREQKYMTGATQDVLMAYFEEQSTQVKPSSLWSRYSMLKCMLNIKENVDISKFPKLIPYLKKIMIGYNPKKSKVFTKDQIDQFMAEAPDQDYLVMKLVLIFGVCGGLRRDELVKLSTTDIKDVEAALLVTVPDIKTKTQKTFTVSDPYYMNLYRKYIDLLPAERDNNRLFWKYAKGKCVRQVVGINQIAKIPMFIAKYLNLPDVKEYTAHCYRKTSGIVVGNFTPEITNLAAEAVTTTTTSATPPGFSMTNCTNCVVNLYVIQGNKS